MLLKGIKGKINNGSFVKYYKKEGGVNWFSDLRSLRGDSQEPQFMKFEIGVRSS